MDTIDAAEIIGDVGEGEIILLVAPSDQIAEVNQGLVAFCSTEHDAATVYVTVTKPSQVLAESFKEAGANTDNIFFIDGATQLAGGPEMQRAENVVFLEPEDLTSISIAMSEAVESLPEDRPRILIFDTLSTLTIYNENDTVSQFAHSLTSKIRKWGIKSVVMTVSEETDEKVKSSLVQFADRIIEV